MKKLLLYAVASLMLMLNIAAGCGSNNNDLKPQTSLGLVGGRWEVQSNTVQLFNWDSGSKALGKERSSVKFGPGLGYIFNSDGTYDGCAMTLSDWTFPSGTPNNDWKCTSKGGGGTWKYAELSAGKSRDGQLSVLGKLTIYPFNKKPAELSYDVYLYADGNMGWEKDEVDPTDAKTMIWTTIRLKRQ